MSQVIEQALPGEATTESASEGADEGLRLLADVGGTTIRFALESATGQWLVTDSLPTAPHASLEDAVRAFLARHEQPLVRHAAFSVPNPVGGDWVRITNHPWQFSVEAMRRSLKLQTLMVVNDYAALAMGLSRLEAGELVQVGGGTPAAGGVIGLLGAGTGLGVSALVPSPTRPVALSTEGGHVSYAAQDEDEACVVALARERHGHASAERLISGPGLELVHEALARRDGRPPAQWRRRAPEISAAAMAAEPEPLAQRALEVFCAMLGTVAGNLALTLGATGGLYIGGGIVPQILPFFRQSAFRARFEAKGRFAEWLRAIPTYVITAPRPTLDGTSAMLQDHLSAEHGAQRLLGDVKAALPNLSTSERVVAQDVLSAPRAWLTDPIAQIAERCDVSTPTVMRFCRSMGFKGLSDFKLRLGAGLSGRTQVPHRDVDAAAPTSERLATVIDNSISALVALRDRLRPEAFDRAVSELAHARRIEIFGVGAAALTADDAQHKLSRLGLVAVARTDTQLQHVISTFLSSEDVLLVISNSGSIEALNEAVARARRGGTVVIAMCPQRSDLTRLADVVLPVDRAEDAQALVPMVSLLMQAVIVDALVADLALKRRETINRSLARQDDHRFLALSSHSR